MLRRAGGGRLPRRGARPGARRARVLRRGVPGAGTARGAGGELHGRRSAPRAIHAPARERVRRCRRLDARAVRPEHRRLCPQGAAAPARVGGAAPARGAARGAPGAAVHQVPAAPALHEPHRRRELGRRGLMDPAEPPARGVIAFAGALIFGLTGFGSALITIPLASHLVPLPFALALFALADLVSAFGVGLEKPRNAVRGEWTRLVPMILAGTAVGVTALVNLPRAVGMLLLGVFVLSFALYSLVRRPGSRVISAQWAWPAGFAGGITSALFGAGGPPYAIYLSQRGLTKEQFRATLGFATMTSISLRVLAFFVTGVLLDPRVWIAAAVAVPAAFGGIMVSRRVFRLISRDTLLRAVTVMLLASGASLIVRALG